MRHSIFQQMVTVSGVSRHTQVNRLRGVSRMTSLDIILERAKTEYTQEEKDAFAAEKSDTYRELLKDMPPSDLLNIF